MTDSRATVVITGAGTVTCQSVIKGLRMQSEIPVEIVTVDVLDDVAGRYFSDAFHRVPHARDPEYVDAILDVCRRHRARLLVPIVDYEFGPLSAAIDRFHDIGCLVAVSPPNTIAITGNKVDTNRFFVENNFPAARTWPAAEARQQLQSLPYPVFLKPAVDGRSSIDCYQVNSPQDLELYLGRVQDAMVQELIRGEEFTADVLTDWQSRALALVVRERIETKGGVSYKGRTVDDPEMSEQVTRMVGLLGLTGPANIQSFRTRDQLIFNEINPRFSGALALSLAAGVNTPLLLLKLAMGIPVESEMGRTRVGVTMLRYWDEVFLGPDGWPEYPEYHLAASGATAGAL